MNDCKDNEGKNICRKGRDDKSQQEIGIEEIALQMGKILLEFRNSLQNRLEWIEDEKFGSDSSEFSKSNSANTLLCLNKLHKKVTESCSHKTVTDPPSSKHKTKFKKSAHHPNDNVEKLGEVPGSKTENSHSNLKIDPKGSQVIAVQKVTNQIGFVHVISDMDADDLSASSTFPCAKMKELKPSEIARIKKKLDLIKEPDSNEKDVIKSDSRVILHAGSVGDFKTENNSCVDAEKSKVPNQPKDENEPTGTKKGRGKGKVAKKRGSYRSASPKNKSSDDAQKTDGSDYDSFASCSSGEIRTPSTIKKRNSFSEGTKTGKVKKNAATKPPKRIPNETRDISSLAEYTKTASQQTLTSYKFPAVDSKHIQTPQTIIVDESNQEKSEIMVLNHNIANQQTNTCFEETTTPEQSKPTELNKTPGDITAYEEEMMLLSLCSSTHVDDFNKEKKIAKTKFSWPKLSAEETILVAYCKNLGNQPMIDIGQQTPADINRFSKAISMQELKEANREINSLLNSLKRSASTKLSKEAGEDNKALNKKNIVEILKVQHARKNNSEERSRKETSVKANTRSLSESRKKSVSKTRQNSEERSKKDSKKKPKENNPEPENSADNSIKDVKKKPKGNKPIQQNNTDDSIKDSSKKQKRKNSKSQNESDKDSKKQNVNSPIEQTNSEISKEQPKKVAKTIVPEKSTVNPKESDKKQTTKPTSPQMPEILPEEPKSVPKKAPSKGKEPKQEAKGHLRSSSAPRPPTKLLAPETANIKAPTIASSTSITSKVQKTIKTATKNIQNAKKAIHAFDAKISPQTIAKLHHKLLLRGGNPSEEKPKTETKVSVSAIKTAPSASPKPSGPGNKSVSKRNLGVTLTLQINKTRKKTFNVNL